MLKFTSNFSRRQHSGDNMLEACSYLHSDSYSVQHYTGMYNLYSILASVSMKTTSMLSAIWCKNNMKTKTMMENVNIRKRYVSVI